MHIALWTTGLTAIACLAGVMFLSLMPTKNADDAGGAAFLSVFVGIAGAACTLAWIVLVFIKAASA